MRTCLIIFILLCLTFSKAGAQVKQDTIKSVPGNKLREVVIHPYFSIQPLIRATGTISIVDTAILDKQQGTSLLPALNAVPGLRMEERSPGSYRLSIRGSLLRSPFGIRNVKIYLDEFPLTDAGGNSYLNALDVAGIAKIQVLKGPQSSIYGANSGGVILIQPGTSTEPVLQLQGGSFGLFKENAAVGQQWKKYLLNITQAYQRSDGYRDHSAPKI